MAYAGAGKRDSSGVQIVRNKWILNLKKKKKAGIAIIVSDKVDLRAKRITERERNEDGMYNIMNIKVSV